MKQSKYFANKGSTSSAFVFKKASSNQAQTTLFSNSNNNSSSSSSSSISSSVQVSENKSKIPQPINSDNDVCPICLSSFKNRVLISNCRHSYCKDCIITWARKSPSCPLCKIDIASIVSMSMSGSTSSGSGSSICSRSGVLHDGLDGEVLMVFEKKTEPNSDEDFDVEGRANIDYWFDIDDEDFAEEGHYPSYYSRFQRPRISATGTAVALAGGNVDMVAGVNNNGYEEDGFVVPDEEGVEYETDSSEEGRDDDDDDDDDDDNEKTGKREMSSRPKVDFPGVKEESSGVFDEDEEEKEDEEEVEEAFSTLAYSNNKRRKNGKSSIDSLDRLCEEENNRMKELKRRKVLAESQSEESLTRLDDKVALSSDSISKCKKDKHVQRQYQYDEVSSEEKPSSLDDFLQKFTYQEK